MASASNSQTFINRYGVSQEQADLMAERQKVYGDPLENHRHIGEMFTMLLKPWADHIKDAKPIPPHVVALMMCAVKLSRQRTAFHQDNFDDMANYQAFAAAWHREWEEGQ